MDRLEEKEPTLEEIAEEMYEDWHQHVAKEGAEYDGGTLDADSFQSPTTVKEFLERYLPLTREDRVVATFKGEGGKFTEEYDISHL